MTDEHQPLPVAGYVPQPMASIDLVNSNKVWEEKILRVLDGIAMVPGIDRRWLAIGRTHIEHGFMAINRAIFQPQRVVLPDDVAETQETPVPLQRND